MSGYTNSYVPSSAQNQHDQQQPLLPSLTTTSSNVSGLKILPDTQACYIIVLLMVTLSLIPHTPISEILSTCLIIM